MTASHQLVIAPAAMYTELLRCWTATVHVSTATRNKSLASLTICSWQTCCRCH